MEVKHVLIYLPDGKKEVYREGSYGVRTIKVISESLAILVTSDDGTTKLYSQMPFVAS